MARPSTMAKVRKKEILENFYQVLIDEGLQGASMAKIAARMGVQPSLLVHYFSTKEEMVDSLVDYIALRYEETFLPTLNDIEDPKQRLALLLEEMFSLAWYMLVDNSAFYACYYLSFRSQNVKDRFQGMYLRLREVLVQEIRRFRGEDRLSTRDAESIAELVIMLLAGFNYYSNIFDNDSRFAEHSRELSEYAMKLIEEFPGSA